MKQIIGYLRSAFESLAFARCNEKWFLLANEYLIAVVSVTLAPVMKPWAHRCPTFLISLCNSSLQPSYATRQ